MNPTLCWNAFISALRSRRPRRARNLRTFLDLSTAHLPPRLGQSLNSLSGVHAYELMDDYWSGWWLWVPESVDEADDPVPPEIIAIWRHARDLGCDCVFFDPNAETDPALPTWDW